MNENKNVNVEMNMEERPATPIAVEPDVAIEGTRDEIVTAITPAELLNPTASAMYCSIKNDGSVTAKAKIYNAINSPEKKIADCINNVINVKDAVAHSIELVDENTGELINALRVVLIDDKGVTYEAVSGGVANALSRLFQIFGQPDTWEKPLPIKVIQKATRNGNNKVTTLEVAL